VKLGIVGTNFVATWLTAAARELGVTLYALYSRSEEKGRAFAAKEGIARVYTDFDAFLSSGIEALYLASPTYCHYTMAKAALTAGLHVLVEKPMVTHLWQLEELTAIAAERGLVLMEAMRPAHDPALSLVREAIGKIGKVRRVSLEFCQYSSRYDAFRTGEILNAFTPEISGAALLDIGIYPLYWAIALFGAPLTVAASSTRLSNGFEGGGMILFGYRDFQLSISYSKIANSVTESAIVGEDGAVTVDKLTAPKVLRLLPRGGTPGTLSDHAPENNLVHELSDFLTLCQKGGENPWLSESHLLYETLERVYTAMGLTLPI